MGKFVEDHQNVVVSLRAGGVEYGKAWHQSENEDVLIAQGRAFDGPIPRTVVERLVVREPVVLTPQGLMGDTLDAEGFPTWHPFADGLGNFVVSPWSGKIINCTGKDYNKDLHLQADSALDSASAAGLDVVSAFNLGDGSLLGMSMVPKDGLVIGGHVPFVSFSSSLCGMVATNINTGSIREVCYNTVMEAIRAAHLSLSVRRTKNSAAQITPAILAEKLELSIEQTKAVAAEFERMTLIGISDAQLTAILEGWKATKGLDKKALTIARNQQNEIRAMLTDDPRVAPFGQTVAGVTQAVNTWHAWSQRFNGEPENSADALMARIARQAKLTNTDKVAATDAAFWAIVSSVVPEATRAVVPA